MSPHHLQPPVKNIPKPWNEPNQVAYYRTPAGAAGLHQALQRAKQDPELIPLLIHGQEIYDGERLEIPLPHDHQTIFAQTFSANTDQLAAAVSSCLQAQQAWGELSQSQRSAVFLKAAERIAGPDRYDILAATMLAQNKTVEQAEWDAICQTVDYLRYQAQFAEQIHSFTPECSTPGEWSHVEARALEGVVLALGPFNFTAISVNLAVAPALMGCAVIWKPSLEALPASWLCLKILMECGLPPGIINLLSGDPQLIGQHCLSHPELAGLHFTGSTQTFRKLWHSIGANMEQYRYYPRIVGETGGKGFVFAHPSAHPGELVCALVRGAFEYQGQKCSAASRAYVPASLWRLIKGPLLELTTSLKMGAPHEDEVFVAALINRRAFNKVKGYIDLARQDTATYEVLCGGECDDSQGYFVEPTIIQTHNPQSQLMSEEIFGPVLTVWVYADDEVEHAARLCDRTSPFALTGAVIARDRGAIVHLSRLLRYCTGNLYVNVKPTGAVVGQQPFGGSRASGTNDKAGSALMLQRWVNYRTTKEKFLHNDPLCPFSSLEREQTQHV